MVTTSLWLAAVGPASLASIGIHAARAPRLSIRCITWLAEAAALLALAAALVTAAAVAVHASLQSSTLGLNGIGFSLYADRLSAVMVCLVAFVGAIVVAYSRTYIDGDPGSTVNNDTFGCGNKMLHNVAGTIGVLEGNAGDLRVGLPRQSLHNGNRYINDPVRLNVMIEAPRAAIDDIIRKHPAVRQLLDNGWLHLWTISAEGRVSARYRGRLTWADI